MKPLMISFLVRGRLIRHRLVRQRLVRHRQSVFAAFLFCVASLSCWAQTPAAPLPDAPSSVAMPKQQTAPPAAAPSSSPANAPAIQATKPVPVPVPEAAPSAAQPQLATPPAQTPQSEAPDDADAATTIVHVVNEVNLVFTATDKHGRFVKDLKAEDIKITDDAKPVSRIRSFSKSDLNS